MEFKIEKVYERDIDLLIINKFMNDDDFGNLFLEKINRVGYIVKYIEHSLMDDNGESDITVIVEKDNKKIALLIEDKIDAIAMPNQSKRYEIRGNKGIKDGKYEEFFVFIIAPSEYLNSNEESKKYPNRISYEEIIEYLKNEDEYAKTLLEKAIEEKKAGYIIIENENVTKFWEMYYSFIREYYPTLDINEVRGPRGSKANWPTFKTNYKNIKVFHKSDRGCMDLTFGRMGENPSRFINLVKSKLQEGMTIERTGKSMAIRLRVPCIDFKMNFNDQTNKMKICMDATVKLVEFLQDIDVLELYEE